MTETARFSDYFELTKPRLSLLSVLTAMAGYAAVREPHEPLRWLWVFLGTALAAGGVAALNQYMEVDTDAQMHRTATRPLPSGKVATGSAFVMGALMCAAALMLLLAQVNAIAAFFTLLTIFSYLGWYTPAKRTSRWSTEIGAVAGALPPLIGTTAAAGRLEPMGYVLFGILFFWQIPHFMAIAWMYRKDYTAVHFPMASVRDPSGHKVAILSLVHSVLLVAVTLVPLALQRDTWWYGAVAIGSGAWLLYRSLVFCRREGRDAASRQLFFASIVYLPLVLGALVADRVIFVRP